MKEEPKCCFFEMKRCLLDNLGGKRLRERREKRKQENRVRRLNGETLEARERRNRLRFLG